MRILLMAIAMAGACGAAAASGGISCEASDSKASFNLSAGVTRGMGAPIFQFRGELEIKNKKVAADLRKTVFEMPHVAQYWLDGKDLRLGLYREREGDLAHGYVELVIYTRPSGEEGSYAGTYEASTYDTVDDKTPEAQQTTVKGKVTCFAE